eukprot:1911516-Lingulodinium_polyedra.AAC.1
MAQPPGAAVQGAAERPASRVPVLRASGSAHPPQHLALLCPALDRQVSASSVSGRPSTCRIVHVCHQCPAGRHGWRQPGQP